MVESAYVHLPFCRRRCFYCDFPITVLGDNYASYRGSMEEYVGFLCEEILATPVLGKGLKTVFFGGGTPSLLPVSLLTKIIETLRDHFSFESDLEMSIEIDPGTFTLDQIIAYRELGVNRFSLGVQAFQDELLIRCGRSHNVKDIVTAVALLRQGGITNLSLDLISGLPYQSLLDWKESLKCAIDLSPEHLSCYDLVIESVTPFGKQYQAGKKPLPDDEMTALMYVTAQELLTEAGYVHYEVSNYGKTGFECRHNQVYWLNQEYYSFGLGSASYTQGKRFSRPRTRSTYYQWVKEYEERGGVIESPVLSPVDRLLETLMLGLRLAKGVNLQAIKEQFGQDKVDLMIKTVDRYLQKQWVILEPNQQLRLSDPQGFLFSNTILSDLFEALD